MKTLLLRHVESLSNLGNIADSQIDSDLSEKGLNDAINLIPTLNKYKFDAFVVSPLQRTIKTIQPFLDTISNPNIITTKLLLERDLGEYTGSPLGTFQKYCEENNLDRISTRPQGGESIVDVLERAKILIAELKKDYSDKTVLICGSKVLLLCLEVAITNKEIKDYYSFKSFENGELKEFDV